MAHRRRQGGHRARLLGGASSRWPRSARWRSRCGAAGPSSRSCWSSIAIVFIGVHEIKAAVDRPRPAGGAGRTPPAPRSRAATPPTRRPLRLAGGDDRASGCVPGSAARRAIVSAGIVAHRCWSGSRRVYLGVHYLSDVSGGWALGVAAFSSARRPPLTISTVAAEWFHAAAGAPEDRELSTSSSAPPG